MQAMHLNLVPRAHGLQAIPELPCAPNKKVGSVGLFSHFLSVLYFAEITFASVQLNVTLQMELRPDDQPAYGPAQAMHAVCKHICTCTHLPPAPLEAGQLALSEEGSPQEGPPEDLPAAAAAPAPPRTAPAGSAAPPADQAQLSAALPRQPGPPLRLSRCEGRQ